MLRRILRLRDCSDRYYLSLPFVQLNVMLFCQRSDFSDRPCPLHGQDRQDSVSLGLIHGDYGFRFSAFSPPVCFTGGNTEFILRNEQPVE